MTPMTPEQIATRCGQLARFHDYRDVRDVVFDGSLAALLDAAADQHLPPATQTQVEETLPARALEVHLLRRILRAIEAQHRDTGQP